MENRLYIFHCSPGSDSSSNSSNSLDEFYDYDGLGLNESTSMGSIVVLE